MVNLFELKDEKAFFPRNYQQNFGKIERLLYRHCFEKVNIFRTGHYVENVFIQ